MRGGTAIEKPEIHGGLIRGNLCGICPDIGPGAIVGIKSYADVCIWRIIEINIQVGVRNPPISLFPDQGLLTLRTL